MSAAGRLWRRAPAWRLLVITALASTALAVMFPPAVPKWLPLPGRGAAGAGLQTFMQAPPAGDGQQTPANTPSAASQSAPAHFVPQPEPPALATGSLQLLHNAIDRTGLIPFAGRQIPLPAGVWKDLVLVRIGGVIPSQREILARMENGQLTGLLQAEGPGPASGAAGLLVRPEICSAQNTMLQVSAPESPDQNPMVHECWLLLDSNMTSAAKRDGLDDAMKNALNRVEQLGAKVPDHMLMLLYVRSDQTGWLDTLLLLPDSRDTTASASRRIQSWIRRYAAALHQGYDSRLSPSGLPAAAARDPT